ncbi:MAG: glycosyltransferase [Acidobacteriota bacterium]|nr:glycosyltransferase [Acidobacteriota bacterium]
MLQLAPRVCWPLDTGAKLRNYHLGRVLSEHARVSLLAFIHDGEPPAIPGNFYQQVLTVRREPGYTTTKILRGAVSRTPLPLLNYTTESMSRALKGVLAETDFDIVQVESIHLMGYLPIIRAARSQPLIVCDWHNIESELMGRYSEREGNIIRRSYARRTARLMRNFEQRALDEFDAHVTVSERDAERLRSLNSKARIFVIENGVDAANHSEEQLEQAYEWWRAQQTPSNPPIRNRIVFVGSMDYHANIDGAVSFSREVWPHLRERKPDLTFTIVGRDPAPEVRELALTPGIEVTGTVDDVRPYYREAIAAVVPLKVGGGSRLKILEAMAAGVPVVSTVLGAEGLELTHDKNILVADTTEKMIEAIVKLIEKPEQRKRLREAGHSLISNRYDWSRIGRSLFECYVGLLAGR